jgi:hypothetical protein
MHIEIRLTLREDSLPDKQLQDLADAVLHAPVGAMLSRWPLLTKHRFGIS